MNMQCKTMLILSDLGYLLRSGLLLQFLGLFRLFESVYMILRTLLLESVTDLCSGYIMSVCSWISMLILPLMYESCLIRFGSMCFVLIIFRSGNVVWKTYAEPVRISLCA